MSTTTRNRNLPWKASLALGLAVGVVGCTSLNPDRATRPPSIGPARLEPRAVRGGYPGRGIVAREASAARLDPHPLGVRPVPIIHATRPPHTLYGPVPVAGFIEVGVLPLVLPGGDLGQILKAGTGWTIRAGWTAPDPGGYMPDFQIALDLAWQTSRHDYEFGGGEATHDRFLLGGRLIDRRFAGTVPYLTFGLAFHNVHLAGFPPGSDVSGSGFYSGLGAQIQFSPLVSAVLGGEFHAWSDADAPAAASEETTLQFWAGLRLEF